MSPTSVASDEQVSRRPERVADAPRMIDRQDPRVMQVTGRMVFGLLVGFFAVVIGVNAVLVHEAISTFGGMETDGSYRAGQLFGREVALAKAQDAQQWRVEA